MVPGHKHESDATTERCTTPHTPSMHSASPQKALSVALGSRFMTQSFSIQQSAVVVQVSSKRAQLPFESPSSIMSARAA